MNKKIYIGIILFLFSYLQLFLPKTLINFWSLGFFYFLFVLGIILICEGITQKIIHKSFIKVLTKDKKSIGIFFLVATIGGIGLDGTSQWLGKLWFYPYYSPIAYYLLFIGGFALYWLTILESYLATKIILDFVKKGRKIVTKHYKGEVIFMRTVGILGALLVPFSVFMILKDYSVRGGYIFSISPIVYKINFGYVILIFLGLWLLFESAEYSRRKTSLLKNVFHKYYTPFLAILLASFFLAIAMEFQNIVNHYWLYLNWPFENIRLFGLPIMMLLAWPLHYIAFLSLFRATTDTMSDEIWSGDKIE